MPRVTAFVKTTLLCRWCKKDKGESDFSPHIWAKYARRAVCRSCRKEYNQERYKQQAATQSLTRHERVLAVQAIKVASGCQECGEKHPACLEFHHRDRTTKTRGVGTMVRMEEILAEIAKCVVLCANCHRKHHWKQGDQGRPRTVAIDGVLPMHRKQSA